jgi:hypothetical protein
MKVALVIAIKNNHSLNTNYNFMQFDATVVYISTHPTPYYFTNILNYNYNFNLIN